MKKLLLLTVFAVFFTSIYSGFAQAPVCGGTFMDPGLTANYANSTDNTVTIYPSNAGDKVTVTFTSFSVESNYDGLYVFDGNSISAPQIASSNAAASVPGGLAGAFWGTAIPGPFTSTSADGSLTFRFRSDSSVNQAGWVANVTCAPPPTCVKPTLVVTTNTTLTSTTIGWNENNTANQWEVLVLPFGSPTPTATQAGISCSTNPFIISGLSAGTSYIVYVRSNCSSTDTSAWSSPSYFTTLSCSTPSNILVSGITTSTANINWTASNLATEWEIIVQPSNISAPTTASTGIVTTSTTYQATGLSLNTTYNVFVRSHCGDNIGSAWSNAVAFTTAPPVVPDPICGGQFTDNGGATTNYLTNSNVTYTICPSNPTDVVTVNFTQFNTEANFDALYVYNGSNTSAAQMASNNGAGFVPGGPAGGYWGNTIPGPFTASNPSGCLTFVFRSDSSVSYSGWMADVVCAPAPTCPKPYSVHTSSISYNTANIGWAEAGSATQWEVLVQPSSALAPTASSTGTTTSSNTFNAIGLTAGTSYNVYVRALCSSSDVSEWSNVITFTTTACSAPLNTAVSNITQNSAIISWTSTNSGAYEIYLSPSATVPTASTMGTVVSTNTYQVTGLACDTNYHVFVRNICSSTLNSAWTSVISFNTTICFEAGNPVNLTQCDDNGQYCFDFTNNSTLVLANLNPADYTIAYYTSAADAQIDVNPIINTNAFCATGLQTVYLKITNNTTQQFQIKSFTVNATDTNSNVVVLTAMTLCDDNNDGTVIYNLTTASSQINSSNTLTYYGNLNDASNATNAIANPAAFVVSIGTPTVVIYIRESISGQCDHLYSLTLSTYSGCGLAYNCNQANSLCSSLGTPFTNTHQGISSNTMGCLATTPNPTWFYLPVSSPGTINLTVEQSSNINFTSGMLDVDYIVYGPFSDPVTPCASSLTQANIVSCSYSAAATEYPVIPNAQVGQYYLLMTTNYSNQAGFIRISMNDNSTAVIDCSGLRLNAFLDSNNNGTKDNDEQNFPMGEFHYDINFGTPHNITAPSGIYNIYDTNNTNSYNLSYTIDPEYTSMYSISTAAYNNVNVIIGGGMTTYNFPITSIESYNDVAVNIIPLTAPRAGWYYQNKIVYTNLGSQTIPTGTITFTNNPGTTIGAISQAGTTTTPTGFTYDFSNLLPFETRVITVNLLVPSIPTVSIGQLLTNSVAVTPAAADLVAENNSSSSTQAIIAAYDPNDKTESHGDRIEISSFTPNDYLYYTIRFENTGNVSAVNVTLNDLLDGKLEENTVKMIASSHSYTLDRVNNNLNWKFNNIELPVSVADTEIGKGYVTFAVKPKAGYSVGDIIPNTAAIYFDSNPAIITNTFTTEFVTTLGTSVFASNGFMLYPNPATNFVNISIANSNDSINNIIVYDMLGKNIKEVKNISSVETTLEVSNLARGVYMVEIKTTNGLKESQKLIVK
ncbi:T9SS type A sorting domain-containing protein [Flavobacterium sp. SUN046]|uniref:DUF7619 domain-containing protein n=1 Tax=Flavobacterium sp. SUN046 TaxID=3002440 RepID=UPI002DBC535C|nr:T9SS type A sorting domain-containing protein [Flavobacterium sp. SUN046]MEC4049150.1 T9SS type A sorting domain-containing protein [Flavobacterium sp. SUN046]